MLLNQSVQKSHHSDVFLEADGGQIHWFKTRSKEVELYVSLWENDPTSHLIYYLSKYFPKEFIVLIYIFKSSLIQCDVIFIIIYFNSSPI